MGQFDTSKLTSGGASGGGIGDGNNSVGTATPSSSYRPGYSSGASTPTESIDGSNHRGGKRGSVNGKNPKQLTHSNSILGLDRMIDDRNVEGNLTSNVVHIEVRAECILYCCCRNTLGLAAPLAVSAFSIRKCF